MRQSTLALAIIGIAGAGIFIALLLRKPSIYVGAGASYSVTNISSSSGGTTVSVPAELEKLYDKIQTPAVQLRVPRLPRINNGDDVQTMTSYIPGGY